MTTTRIQEKISRLVSSQFPEFVQTDYSKFVSFVEAYYRFLEQDQGALEVVQNARSYNDIDKTTESFIQYFINTYASELPVSTSADKRLLVKNIKDFYESKGSEISFKYLFNLLFQTNVDVEYPYQYVLRASAGKWQQRNSLRILTIEGNRDEILNRTLLYTSRGQDFSTPIIEVKNLTDILTEVFLDSNFLASEYQLGDFVEVREGNNLIFRGVIDPTPTTSFISRAGSGFKRGQIYNINFAGGSGTLVKVSNVTPSGGVEEIKFISFGGGYPDFIFTVDLDPNKTVSEIADIISDRTQGFKSFGSILSYSNTSPSRYFLENYVDEFYVFSSEVSFSDNVFNAASTTTSKPDNYATIQFNPGALGTYPGSFVSNEGLISEFDVRLENDLLYQPFAYQTNTDVDISLFFDIVTKLIHPAGQRLFNNRILSVTADLQSNVSVIARANIFVEALSSFDTPDLYSANISKPFIETIPINESNSYVLSKPIEDSTISISDTFKLFQSVFQDNISPIEASILNISKIQSDIANTIEQAELTINKQIESNVAFSETGLGTIQSYFAEAYVGEDYVGSSFTLI